MERDLGCAKVIVSVEQSNTTLIGSPSRWTMRLHHFAKSVPAETSTDSE